MFEIEAAGLPARSTRPVAGRLDRPFGPSLEFLTLGPERPSGGAPVLLLHGAFTGAWCWQESWMPALSASGRFAAALSLRGHGHSEGRAALPWTGLHDFAEDLIRAIRAMPAPPVLVAHSIGGLIAQHLLAAVAFGQVRLRGLVLVGSLPPEGLALVGPQLGLSLWLEALAGSPGRLPDVGHRDAMFGAGVEPAAAAAYAARIGTDMVLPLCLGSFASLAQAYVPLPVLPAWTLGLPTLVLHGSDDRLVDTAAASRTALYHGGTLERIAGAGHCPMLGHRSAAGARVLIDWLGNRGL
ncbi:hypothetical protein ASG52_21785 [Methylobacterium sp. Leaf456]|uniref:alpha/beta hydrolase n=1 Tax=Methylobacterium sp. Leaf456 TaxID=1736382 RepID=UPI0006FEDE8E|nr:alpha/beta fold hydrolase [Methylobacterium sp. Leaf456]KQT58485.1 hypothetical protein ASG52_21785 [Methylobacterium sp. Leaf456]